MKTLKGFVSAWAVWIGVWLLILAISIYPAFTGDLTGAGEFVFWVNLTGAVVILLPQALVLVTLVSAGWTPGLLYRVTAVCFYLFGFTILFAAPKIATTGYMDIFLFLMGAGLICQLVSVFVSLFGIGVGLSDQ
ncbi:hypothetical protein A2716_01715 [candidate division WWE3 bacterium RIFCSPHIGHO2_01_FULL_40_23]|uniref:Uncharacterized protein n=1 Tax=candidate division WWE3 bacterium RIFCSPLOWO2_01_FULL_41_18 TaxID=1802625 RepID=A0A1F4VFI6_UNCKA|nr:MAG: hypothetical protein A2716_01715 [candidate division WWE3 bacterium RIFCSPHIGHO2_01_FULL_40_23]OGC55710.1 MAG: hypothetical protein A3A78_01565 [candidate division WWE3 bacterium RIFCSPLOWO2_01_FULL_41_18]